MILLVIVKEKNESTGKMETIVSHGIDFDTGNNVCLQQVELSQYTEARHSPDLGWYLP